MSPPLTPTVTVTRYWLHNPGRLGRWAYNYTVSGNAMLCQYGPGLSDLRARLAKKYPGATIIETWKA